MNQIFDYKPPTPPEKRLSLRAAAVGGVVAGTLTFCSVFLVGPLLYLGVGALAGIVLSAVAARASRGFEFRAGFLASGFAAAAAFVAGILNAPFLGVGIARPDPQSAVLAVAFWWALFAIPGLFGSVWFWDGRRPRHWDQGPRAG